MTLTIGSGPFGQQPAGVFNFDADGPPSVLYFEDCPRRIRAAFNGHTVVDTTRAKYLHETGHLPVYYFPLEDCDGSVLEPTEHTTHCPWKGDASYWSVRVGDRVAENAVWTYPEPLEGSPPLAGYVAIAWDAMDGWFEEDEELIGHPRDPYHRVDVRQSSWHVKAVVNGQVVAETDRPWLLFETGLPTRYYFPSADVHTELLSSSETQTVCPYKGIASYWSADIGGRVASDVAFSYPDPLPEASKVTGALCFLGAEVELEIDGQLETVTPHPH
jgi:uncharacterized protein (DUF427 family)